MDAISVDAPTCLFAPPRGNGYRPAGLPLAETRVDRRNTREPSAYTRLHAPASFSIFRVKTGYREAAYEDPRTPRETKSSDEIER